MSDFTYEVCSHEDDARAAFSVVASTAVEQQTPFLSASPYRRAFKNKEMVIAKDGGRVIGVRTFQQIGEKIIWDTVVVHKNYRRRGISSGLRRFCLEEWKKRGATYEEVMVPQNHSWLNIFVVERGAKLLRTHQINKIVFNVYERVFETEELVAEPLDKDVQKLATKEPVYTTRGDMTSDVTWSLKRIPLVPGYWCVCVAPLREEWGEYAGKIFLAKADIRYYAGGAPE